MPISSYLLRRGRTFYLRVRLPHDLAGRIGRREIVRTLGSHSPTVARHLAATIALRFTELWALARMATTDSEIERLLDRWFTEEMQKAYKPLGERTFAQAVTSDSAGACDPNDVIRALYADDAWLTLEQGAVAYRAGDYTAGESIADELVRRLATPPNDHNRTRDIIAKRVVQALGVLLDARIRWAQGEPEYRPAAPWRASEAATGAPGPGGEKATSPTVAATPPDTGEALGMLVDRYLKEDRVRPGQITKHHNQLASELRLMMDEFGAETPILAIDKRAAGRLFQALRCLPARFRENAALKRLSLADMRDKAIELGLPPMNPRTVNGYVGSMRKFFEEQKTVGRVQSNPFDGMHARGKAEAAPERGFTKPELAALLNSPLFMGAKSDQRPYDPGGVLVGTWQFWAVVIALTTGARIAEVAQLTPTDIHEAEGVWVISINAHGDKRVKNVGSTRLVPIHSQLHRLGIITLLEQRQARQALRLLPDCPAPVGGDPGKQLSKWMSEKFLVRLGLKRAGLGHHAFRHSLRTMLREAGVADSVGDRITGHATPGVGNAYGRYPPAVLRDALERVVFPAELAAIPARFPATAPAQPNDHDDGDAANTHERNPDEP